jgi:hypothetical protein
VSTDGVWTTRHVDEFAAEWKRFRGGPVRLLTPLPRHVRLRLAVMHAVDGAAIWLAERRQYNAAELLWRISGGWR